MAKVIRMIFLGLPIAAIVLLIVVFTVALSIAPKRPPPLASFEASDRTIGTFVQSLPPLEHLAAAHGSPIAYRSYPGRPGAGWVIAVHGSSGSSIEMHAVAAALAQSGFAVYCVDLRGHGDTGRAGDIDYNGELEDDLAALVDRANGQHPGGARLLVGHSLGGGFTMRIAAGRLANRFTGFLPISPFVGQDFPGHRPNSGDWVDVSVPRIVALTILNRFGISAFDGLPVIAYAVPDQALGRQTAFYSHRLLDNYAFPRDWRAALPRMHGPMHILIGADDELFVASTYPQTIANWAPQVSVEIVPGMDHMGMVLQPAALDRIVAAAEAMPPAASTPQAATPAN
eukprot:gene22636-23852_t